MSVSSSKRSNWSSERSCWKALPRSIASSNMANCSARCPSRDSVAPHWIRDSRTRRFTCLKSTRAQRSNKSRKGRRFLSRRMASIAWVPTFLTASSPKRIAFPSTRKERPLRFTSGGSTSMPMRRHSSTYSATFSGCPSRLSAWSHKCHGYWPSSRRSESQHAIGCRMWPR